MKSIFFIFNLIVISRFQTYENVNRVNLIDQLTLQPCFNSDFSDYKLYKGSDYYNGTVNRISVSGWFLFKGFLNDNVILSMYYRGQIQMFLKYSPSLQQIDLSLNGQTSSDVNVFYSIKLWFFIIVDINYDAASSKLVCQVNFIYTISSKLLQVELTNWNSQLSMSDFIINLGNPAKSMNILPSCAMVSNVYLYWDSQFDITSITKPQDYISSTQTYLLSHFDLFYTDANPRQILSDAGAVQDRLSNPLKSTGTDDIVSNYSTDILNASSDGGLILTFHAKVEQYNLNYNICSLFQVNSNSASFAYLSVVMSKLSKTISIQFNTINVSDVYQWHFITFTIKQSLTSNNYFMTVLGYESQQVTQATTLNLVQFRFGDPLNCQTKISNIRIIQGNSVHSSNNCQLSTLSAQPFCIKCKTNYILDYQSNSSCVDSSFSQTPYGTKEYIPTRQQCPKDMVNDENNPGGCRCQSGFYKDISTNTCIRCNLYCDECIGDSYTCVKQNSNRDQSGLCKTGYFDDGFSCLPPSLKIPLYQKLLIEFTPTNAAGCFNDGNIPSGCVFTNSQLQTNVGDTILLRFSVDITLNASFGSGSYPIGIIYEDNNTVMQLVIKQNISPSYYILQVYMNGNLMREFSPIRSSAPILIIYWTDNSNHILIINQMGYVDVLEISDVKLFATYNIKICVGYCFPLSQVDGCIKISNRGMLFIKGIPYPTKRGIKELYYLFNPDKAIVATYNLVHNAVVFITFVLNSANPTNSNSKLNFGSSNMFNPSKGFRISNGEKGSINSIAQTNGVVSFSCYILIEMLLQTNHFIYYSQATQKVFQVLLVPNNIRQEVFIRICFNNQCKDTKYAKLDYGRINFFMVISNYLTSFDSDDYQEFEVVCNYKREKMRFYAQYQYNYDSILNVNIGDLLLMPVISITQIVYYNNLNFYQANAAFYFDFDQTNPCFAYFGIVNMICLHQKETKPIPHCVLGQYSNGQYVCLRCQDPNTDPKQNCSVCKDKYFLSPISQTCEICSDNCQECSKNKDNCTVCAQNNQVPPTCDCVNNTFYMDDEQKCQSCPKKCSTCEAGGICTACSGSNRTPPLCNCDSQYVDNGSGCIKRICGIQCNGCEYSSNNCLKCSANRINPPLCECGTGYQIMSDGSCSQCDITTYFNEETQTCTNCGQNCVACNQFGCIQCTQGTVLKGSSCVCADESQSYMNNSQFQGCISNMNVQFTVKKLESAGYSLIFTFEQKLQKIDFYLSPLNSLIEIYIPEISQKYYQILNPEINENTLTVQLVPLKNFQAIRGIAIILTNQQLISEKRDSILNQNYVNTVQEFNIGPIVRNDSQATNKALSQISSSASELKKNDSGLFAFINGIQFIFYLLNTLQPSCQFLLLKSDFPQMLYEFYQMVGLFVYPDVPDFQSDPQDKTYSIFNYVLTEKEIKKPNQKKLARLKFHQSLLVNMPVMIIKYLVIFFLLGLIGFLSLRCGGPNNLDLQPMIFKIKALLVNRIDSENEVNLLISMLNILIQLSNIDQEDYLLRIGFYFSILILMLHTVQFTFNFLNLNYYKNAEFSTLFIERIDNRSNSISTRNYFLIQMLKKYIVTGVIYFFYEYPIVVCSTCASLFFLSGISTHQFKPYQDLKSRIIKGVGELILTVVWITHIPLILIEQSLRNKLIIDDRSMVLYDNLGIAIIILLLIYNCLFLLQYFISLYQKIKPHFSKEQELKIIMHKRSQQLSINASELKSQVKI